MIVFDMLTKFWDLVGLRTGGKPGSVAKRIND